MKEFLIDTRDENITNVENRNSNKSFFHNFFIFRFFNLLRISKNKQIKLEDIKQHNQDINIDNKIEDKSDFLFDKNKKLLNFLINKNKSQIYQLIFLSIIRIILLISNPFLFKQFTNKNINKIFLLLIILIIDFGRASISLKIELNSNLLCLSIDTQIKQIIIKNDLLIQNKNDNKSVNERISLCNTIFNNDIENIKHFFYLFPNFFSIPLLFISYYFVLYILFGFTSLISILFLILIILINIYFQGKLKLGQKNKQLAIDQRMSFMTNLIYKLKNIKILLYEKFFYNKIMEKRNEELKKYEILYQTANKIRSLLWASPTILILITIIAHILYCIYYKIEIHVENLLIIFGLIDSFQQPILTLCQTYSYYLISNVSTNRIEQYLSNNKKDKNKNIKEEKIEKIEEHNIVFDKNEIIFIIGDTGCGKSYLLKKLFNNYKNNNNDYYLIYTGQEPFIMNDTIQSNIIFMKENKINNEAYLKILNISTLENDLSSMEKGDLSPSGEGGAFLSGGQKKRISIARALLESEENKSKKQILFFDEPTYSLDPETIVDVWNKCFVDYLKDTIRVIVTNNLELLKYGNKIIYIENKEIIFYGEYSEFKNNKIIYEKYLKLDNLLKKRKDEENKISRGKTKIVNNQLSSQKNAQLKGGNMNNPQINKKKLYIDFIKIMIGGYANLTILLFILFIWMVLRFCSEYFLIIFKSNEFLGLSFSIKKLIIFYVIVNLLACLLLYIRLVLTSKCTISGGRNLHKMMLDPITNISIQASNKSLSSNQLINNFSRDLGMIDFFSSVMFGNCLTFGGAFITLLIVIIVFFKFFAIFIPIFIFVGFSITKIYLQGFRQLVQLETQMRTAIINFIKEINLGKEAIQSYNISDKFINKFNKLYTKYYISQIGVKNSNAWFLYSISRISFILKIIFMIYFFYQIKDNDNLIDQDKIGILFVSMFSLHEYFNRFLSHVVTFENSLLAFNRCLTCTKIKQENENKDKNIILNGIKKEIRFENVCIKYDKTNDNVLKNITFKVNQGEKIGICGKTGVGKTTLLMSLLKVVDINEGKIIFDENIDIKNIDFNTLRENIICITQEINLFDELTIKENIDPYNKYEIKDIKKILNDFSFNEFIDIENKNNSILNLESILFKKVKDINLSFGQKNIICFIRVLLRYNEKRNSIVLIDEMTDKNDFITSDKLVNILFNKFKEGIIFIVSHRIPSIQNCDKILVLEEGKIAEFDSPNKLLSNKNSIFYKYTQI